MVGRAVPWLFGRVCADIGAVLLPLWTETEEHGAPSSLRRLPNLSLSSGLIEVNRSALCPLRVRIVAWKPDASFSLFPADSEGDTERGGDRLASADVARRHDPAGGGGELRLAAAWGQSPAQDLRYCARGAEP